MTIISELAALQSASAYVAGLTISICALGACYALSSVACKFLDSAARQPEISKQLFNNAMIMMGMIDAIPILGAGIGVVIILTSPFASKVVALVSSVS